ncbi:uncharacterized protein MONOS_4863 [Monocercomonoides exilis]|uniref:uncharacterized protein n=1 Tax=Monocercomonoides exilis TaxID=2049356 RepID=UPI003559392C|nr:hypothetical protein MONOS_4863 [Monocercomonoides exilis]|eukprot:MONOS_4863.1-p1 / transcript=MONOS_4863.1 / gene=MONOS_4863 / organism=Monocercomonoides_exilis_PA203 / gene_product=unspecified product / transcript_product=unspecified product / location=Mono_scaffold00135:90474-91096(+) / protein_length=153 / sequence_SO=supercontig / SO=protein_coding / is_pseudo=false
MEVEVVVVEMNGLSEREGRDGRDGWDWGEEMLEKRVGKGREGRRRKKEGLDEGDERGERGAGDGEGGNDWGVGVLEEIVWGGEEGEGEDSWLVGGEGEVCEGDGGMSREEEVAVVVVVVVGEGRWVDGASGGADGGSGVVLGSEEWTTAERR